MRILNNKDICIVGGGSSGLMASLYLTTHHPDKTITLVESPDIPKIGVGEGSIQHIRVFLSNIGIDTNELLKHTNGSYKFSIRFRDFLYKGHDVGIHYPFGDLNCNEAYLQAWSYFISKNKKYKDLTDRVISHQVALCDNNLTGSINSFDVDFDAAFHFDALLFSEYLKSINLKYKNFRYIKSTVRDVIRDEKGYIQEICCDDDIKIKSDLYIDCTGFSRFLIGREKFHSLEEKLPVNKAWTCQIPYQNPYRELKNFTDCVGLSAGWSWLIPLYNRLGCGYVFSDKFIDKEDALQEFKNYLDSDKIALIKDCNRSKNLNFRLVHFETGYQKQAWQKNCISIGLSSGFLEPLEANGLLTTHSLIEHLSEILTREKLTKFDRDHFNIECQQLVSSWSDFIYQHYAISQRKDSDFWKYFKSNKNFEEFTYQFKHGKDPRKMFERNSGSMRIYLGAEVAINKMNYISNFQNLPYKMLADYNMFLDKIHYRYTNNYSYLKSKIHEDF